LEKPAKVKAFVNQRVGDVAEVLHLFDQDRECAIQRDKTPEEGLKTRRASTIKTANPWIDMNEL